MIFFVLFIIIAIFFVFLGRKMMKSNKWKIIDRQWKKMAKRIRSDNTLIDHIVAALVSFYFGITIYFLIYAYILPKTLPIPKTDAINWLTVHGHSMTLDYIRVGLLVFVIPSSIVLGWFLQIWKRDR